MDKKEVIAAIKAVKENSPKRNFKQSIDLIITLKGLDLKKPDQKVDTFVSLHYPMPKKPKICGLVGPELIEQAKEALDDAIHIDDFSGFKNKKDIKKLARSYDFFIAQANIMAKVAQAFGRVFGPRGKMPNPKAGCVVPANANLKTVVQRLQSTVHLKTPGQLMVQANIGLEDSDDNLLEDNIMTIYNHLIHTLPQEKNNIKDIIIKTTMGRPVKLGDVKEEIKAGPAQKENKEKQEEQEEAAKEENKEEDRAAHEKQQGKKKEEPKEKD